MGVQSTDKQAHRRQYRALHWPFDDDINIALTQENLCILPDIEIKKILETSHLYFTFGPDLNLFILRVVKECLTLTFAIYT